MAIQLDVGIEVTTALERALGINETTNEVERKRRLDAFGQQAVDELNSWVTGRERAGTIAELDQKRVNRTFRAIRRHPPTVPVLVQDLSMSHGRAQAMVSRMRYGEAAWIQADALAGLVRELDQPRKSKSWVRKGVAVRDIVLAPSLDRLLIQTLGRSYEDDPTSVPVHAREKADDGIGALWRMTVADWEAVLTKLKAVAGVAD